MNLKTYLLFVPKHNFVNLNAGKLKDEVVYFWQFYVYSNMLAQCIWFIDKPFEARHIDSLRNIVPTQLVVRWAITCYTFLRKTLLHVCAFMTIWTWKTFCRPGNLNLCPGTCSWCFTFTLYRYRNRFLVIKYLYLLTKGTSLYNIQVKLIQVIL